MTKVIIGMSDGTDATVCGIGAMNDVIIAMVSVIVATAGAIDATAATTE